MSENNYQPPKVWEWKQNNGGAFANINRPVSGATHDRELPVGAHPLQLYSLGTPNGQKVTIMLEELLALGVSGAEYDAWLIRIGEGDQFSSGFVEVNPNSKSPRSATTPPPRRPAFLNPAASCSIWRKSSASSCPKIRQAAPKPSTGCSGYKARPRSSAAALATSSAMRR